MRQTGRLIRDAAARHLLAAKTDQPTHDIGRWLDLDTYQRVLLPFGVSLFPKDNFWATLLRSCYSVLLSVFALKALRREIPLRRFGNPDGLGATAVLLLSDRLSPYTTGADVVLDGGLSLRPLTLYSDEEITAMNQ